MFGPPCSSSSRGSIWRMLKLLRQDNRSVSGRCLDDITRKQQGTRYLSRSSPAFWQSTPPLPPPLAILITAASSWHASQWETCVSGNVRAHVGILGSITAITYLKSNTISTSHQLSKSHINQTSPHLKVKKFFPFEIIQMDSASISWIGDTLYRTDGLMALWQTDLSSPGVGGVGGAEKNMYSGLDLLLHTALLSLAPTDLFLNVAVGNLED